MHNWLFKNTVQIIFSVLDYFSIIAPKSDRWVSFVVEYTCTVKFACVYKLVHAHALTHVSRLYSIPKRFVFVCTWLRPKHFILVCTWLRPNANLWTLHMQNCHMSIFCQNFYLCCSMFHGETWCRMSWFFLPCFDFQSSFIIGNLTFKPCRTRMVSHQVLHSQGIFCHSLEAEFPPPPSPPIPNQK